MANIISDIINEISTAKKTQGLRPEETILNGPPFLPSSHLMASGEVDGEYAAWPELFYNQRPLEEGQDAWLDLTSRPEGDWSALEEAMSPDRKELFTFPTKDASERFAEGGWKQENLEPFINSLVKSFLNK